MREINKMKNILLVISCAFVLFSCGEKSNTEKFIGKWIPTKTGNEMSFLSVAPKDGYFELEIKKEEHLYFANYKIGGENGEVIDMYKNMSENTEFSNLNGTGLDIAKQMFMYQLSQDGNFLVNVLKPTESIIEFDKNNGLIRFHNESMGSLWLTRKE